MKFEKKKKKEKKKEKRKKARERDGKRWEATLCACKASVIAKNPHVPGSHENGEGERDGKSGKIKETTNRSSYGGNMGENSDCHKGGRGRHVKKRGGKKRIEKEKKENSFGKMNLKAAYFHL